MIEDGQSVRVKKRYVFLAIFALSAIFVLLFLDSSDVEARKRASEQGIKQASEQARKQASEQASMQASKQAIKPASKQASKQASRQASKQASNQASNYTSEDKKKSVLEPPSQSWAQDQFKKALDLMDRKYSQPNKWESCGMKTYYFENIKTIFTGIPKTGCSNWKEALLLANGDLKKHLNPTQARKVHGRMSNNHRIPKILHRFNASQFQQAFSFTVVRNPWTRMVSGYRDKLSDEKTQGGEFRGVGKNIVKQMRGITDKKELVKLYPTFTEFASWLAKHNGSGNSHFYQQFRTLCIPAAKYDYIIPLEYAGLLSQDVWGIINANTSLLGSYDKSSDPRLQASALHAKEWFSKIDKNTIEKLYNIFRIDFALMDYSNFTHPDFPLPLHDSIR